MNQPDGCSKLKKRKCEVQLNSVANTVNLPRCDVIHIAVIEALTVLQQNLQMRHTFFSERHSFKRTINHKVWPDFSLDVVLLLLFRTKKCSMHQQFLRNSAKVIWAVK